MASRVIGAGEPLILVAITPLLLFPTTRPDWTAVALALLALTWLTRAVVRREPWPVTPFNGALLLFCLSIPLAVWASAAPELTLPKLTGLILGVAAFRVIAFHATDRRTVVVAIAAFALLGAGMWALGLLGMRLGVLQPLVSRLPAGLVSLPGAPDEGVNPNQLAGVLVLYLPFMIALVVLAARERKRVAAIAAAVITAAALATLIFTRSRAGWIAVAVSALVFLAALAILATSRHVKRALVFIVGVALVAGLIAGAVFLPQGLNGAVAGAAGQQQVGDALSQLSLESRVEIWSRALYALQDFPFTGVGLGTFRRVVNLLYPLFLVPPDSDLAHAHNIFLQVGVDLGLGGLVGYVALLFVAGKSAWEVARANHGSSRLLALGLLASLVGLHVYGLADALALGSKPGLAYWMVLGLAAALGNLLAAKPSESGDSLAVGAERSQTLALREGHLGGIQHPVSESH